ncbi:MAG: PQQ-binding-like beta-propeller repeat protein [Bacteroidales bacterium]|nr:PQQ-binding-like beta-propeller repeat protein [Bacteroidales bacterium]
MKRLRLISGGAMLSLMLLCSSITIAQQKVSGIITDTKGNGISGVVVSDGFNIYKSGDKGLFSFDASPRARFVYISTPSGYEQVSPFYIRISGTLSQSFEFRLKRVGKQPSGFIHVGDTEESVYRNYIDCMKEYIINHKVAFLMLNGDICYEKGMRFHAAEITGDKMGVRVVYTMGNHDLIAGTYGEEFYEKNFGPVCYSFNVNNVHFVVTPVTFGDKSPSYSADDVWNWVRKDIEAQPEGTPVVIANHHFYSLPDDFKKYNIKGYLYAHYHTNLFYKGKNGVSTYSSMSPNKGGIDHSPSSFRVISFDDKGNLSSTLKYSALDKHVTGTAFKIPGGIKVVASLYDTGSEVLNAEVLVGREVFKITRKSEWCWGEDLSAKVLSLIINGDNMKLKVKFSDGSVIFKPITFSEDIKWNVNLGAPQFMTSPLIAGEIVVVATTDDEKAERCAIHGIDKITGELQWSVKTQNSVRGDMAYSHGYVIACDVIGRVYCIDPQSGKVIWLRDIRENTIHPVLNQGVVAHGDFVYAGQGASLTAIRVSDGEVVWVNKDWKGGVSTVAAPVVDPGSEVLLTGAYWTGRFANDAISGKLLWEKKDDVTRIADNSPVSFDGYFFYTSPEYITQVDPHSGKELLRQKINYTVNTRSRPVVTDKYYIVGTADKGVVAFDRGNSYKELWNIKTNPALIYTAPYTKDFQMTVESGCALAGEKVYFGANDGFLYGVNVANGGFRKRIELGSPILGNIVVEGETIFVSDFGGNLWAVSLF